MTKHDRPVAHSLRDDDALIDCAGRHNPPAGLTSRRGNEVEVRVIGQDCKSVFFAAADGYFSTAPAPLSGPRRCGRIAVSMVDSDGSPPTSRRRHVVRLAVFACFLLVLFYLVAVAQVIDVEEVRRTVSATGPAAPLAYVVVSAVLGALFVPGPILAAGSGLLFGPLFGIFVTLGATVGTAIVASFIGRRAGRDSARALLGTTRAKRIDALIERRGLWAVVGQRFVPGISDALASYAFGAFGVPLWQMAIGAFIGSVPRAFVYTALGASIGNRSSLLAYAAIAVWCVTAIVGAFAARRGYRKWRGHAGRGGDGDVPDSHHQTNAR